MTMTNKQKTNLFIILVAVAVIIYWYSVRRRNIRNKSNNASDAASYEAEPNTSNFVGAPELKEVKKAVKNEIPSSNFPLKIGSTGKEVRQLQVYLLKHHGGMTNEDLHGNFDEKTERLLERHLNRKTISEQNFHKRNIHLEAV